MDHFLHVLFRMKYFGLKFAISGKSDINAFSFLTVTCQFMAKNNSLSLWVPLKCLVIKKVMVLVKKAYV